MEIIYTKDPEWLEKWDVFVQTNDKGSHLVLSDWVSSYRSYGFDAEYCLCLENGNITGGFAAIIAKVAFFRFYIVPYGPIASGETSGILDELIRFVPQRAKHFGAAYAHVALPIGSHENTHFIGQEIAVQAAEGHQFPYVYSSNGLNWINLRNTTEEAVLDRFKSSTRRDVRAAMRKEMDVVFLETETQVKAGYDLCLANAASNGYALRDWASFKPTLLSLIGKGSAKFIAVYKDNDMKGAILLVKAGNFYTYILGGTKKEKPDLLPGHLLQWEAIRLSLREGLDGYNISLGGSKGVMDFKDSFGTTHLLYERSRYHWVLRPMLFRSYRFFEKRMKPYKKTIARWLSKLKR